MITFTAKILRFSQQGEKTGWSYILISKSHAAQINPGVKKSFRIKGSLDEHTIKQIAILPDGNGNFILPLNATIRKNTGKKAGDTVKVKIELDKRDLKLSSEFLVCLKDDQRAYDFFITLPKGHQSYFSKWIESAKTSHTRVKRITMAVMALANGQGYGEMMRANKKEKLEN